jgi:hypothetical protein
VTFRTVLVHAGLDPDNNARCGAAAALAHRFAARLVGIGAEAFWPFVPPAEVRGNLRPLLQQAQIELEQTHKSFMELGLTAPGGVSWRMAVDRPADAMARFSCLGDLVVAGRPRGLADPILFPAVDDLVMTCGIPVLLIPDWPEPRRCARR